MTRQENENFECADCGDEIVCEGDVYFADDVTTILCADCVNETFDDGLVDEISNPDEDAITTSDHQNFYQYNKLWLTLPRDTDTALMNATIKTKMDADQFFPDVWFISDHGNAHLMSLTD